MHQTQTAPSLPSTQNKASALHTHTYTHTHIHTCTHAHIQTYIHTQHVKVWCSSVAAVHPKYSISSSCELPQYTHIHSHTHTHINIHIHTLARQGMLQLVKLHPYIHTYIHTHTHTAARQGMLQRRRSHPPTTKHQSQLRARLSRSLKMTIEEPQ